MNQSGYIYCFLGILFHLSAYSQMSYQEAVSQGLRFQMQADSLQRLVEAQTATLAVASESQKNRIRNALRDYEAQTAVMQKSADEWFTQAMKIEVPSISDDTVTMQEISDSSAMVRTTKNIETISIRKIDFDILPKSPYSFTNPFPIGESLPDGVVYKIQLGAFSKPIPANTFKGLSPISGEQLANSITKYYAGLFRSLTDAEDALRKVHEYGFKDAFIVAFYNSKTINTMRAKQLETTNN